MRYALILAGGSGTRLWPMSRNDLPKQLIPLIAGKSLLEIAYGRLEKLVAPQRRYVCAGRQHAAAILKALPSLSPAQLLAEPVGRDTLAAIGFGAAAIAKDDPEAVIGVFTADHLIEPQDRFEEIVERGYALAERVPQALVTFGIAPTQAATGYGYLELGAALDDSARVVDRFKEKPDQATAQKYFAAGPEKYLWNSGMFVWRAATLLEAIRRYEPACSTGLCRLADAWGGPQQAAVLADVFPGLKKISIDFAVMEPASHDPALCVAAVPMQLQWLDIGSWPMFAQTCPPDQQGNTAAAPRHLFLDSRNTLAVSSDIDHLIAAVGCEDLLIVHTPDVTLVCRANSAEDIKKVHSLVKQRFGGEYV
jgi:mannose-1-phosphate guanylyltransferase